MILNSRKIDILQYFNLNKVDKSAFNVLLSYST